MAAGRAVTLARKKDVKHALPRGLLIALEGIDGTGKTTQAQLLVDALTKRGFELEMLHEPTSGRWGRKILGLAKQRTANPEDEFRYFYEDRKEDVEKRIRPALEDGKVVVMDRYYASNVAYQGARGIDPEVIERKNLEIAPPPDLIVILDADPRLAVDRIRKLRMDQLDDFEQNLEAVRRVFLEHFRDRQNVLIVDSSRSKLDIHREILGRVDTLLQKVTRKGQVKVRGPSRGHVDCC